jgi:hypothetical protein
MHKFEEIVICLSYLIFTYYGYNSAVVSSTSLMRNKLERFAAGALLFSTLAGCAGQEPQRTPDAPTPIVEPVKPTELPLSSVDKLHQLYPDFNPSHIETAQYATPAGDLDVINTVPGTEIYKDSLSNMVYFFVNHAIRGTQFEYTTEVDGKTQKLHLATAIPDWSDNRLAIFTQEPASLPQDMIQDVAVKQHELSVVTVEKVPVDQTEAVNIALNTFADLCQQLIGFNTQEELTPEQKKQVQTNICKDLARVWSGLTFELLPETFKDVLGSNFDSLKPFISNMPPRGGYVIIPPQSPRTPHIQG